MSVNMIILLGNVGRDFSLKTTNSGLSVVNFPLATSEKSKGEEVTEWHECVAFDKLAEYLSEYHCKGSRLHIVGRVSTRVWTDKEGHERKTKEVIVNRVDSIKRGEKVQIDDDSVPF